MQTKTEACREEKGREKVRRAEGWGRDGGNGVGGQRRRARVERAAGSRGRGRRGKREVKGAGYGKDPWCNGGLAAKGAGRGRGQPGRPRGEGRSKGDEGEGGLGLAAARRVGSRSAPRALGLRPGPGGCWAL